MVQKENKLEQECCIKAATYERIAEFNRQRNWDQFHNPKDMAISISLEAAELLECFQWSGTDLNVSQKRTEILEETADILIYALQLCQVMQADPDQLLNSKITANEAKYPARQAYGSAKKYTELTGQAEP